ncbi:hypothetical protein ACQPYK_41315 [Streptosporangium sp. CA-135522]|uniref:hypothetical protein n=1 Tax=Streptosporangium sp. CA-135522 TaxID=3240072 RepID=UPI003D944FCE
MTSSDHYTRPGDSGWSNSSGGSGSYGSGGSSDPYGSGGYQSDPSGLRHRAWQVHLTEEFVRGLYIELGDVFREEGRPLGNDQYGAELEKNLPRIEYGIFGAFSRYIDEIETTRQNLIQNARVYEEVNHVNSSPSNPPDPR